MGHQQRCTCCGVPVLGSFAVGLEHEGAHELHAVSRLAPASLGGTQQRCGPGRIGPAGSPGGHRLPHPFRCADTLPAAAAGRHAVNPGRADIERMLEHAGDMCLLDSTIAWDNQQIRCSAPAPQAGHPLMREGRLPAIAGAEYAAQAAALHGALLDGVSTPRPGMLANLRDVTFHRMVSGRRRIIDGPGESAVQKRFGLHVFIRRCQRPGGRHQR
jgi:hypothetical protein